MTVITPVSGGSRSSAEAGSPRLGPICCTSTPRSIVTLPFAVDVAAPVLSSTTATSCWCVPVVALTKRVWMRGRAKSLFTAFVAGWRTPAASGAASGFRIGGSRSASAAGMSTLSYASLTRYVESALWIAGSWIRWVLVVWKLSLSRIWRLTQVARIATTASSDARAIRDQTAMRRPRLSGEVRAMLPLDRTGRRRTSSEPDEAGVLLGLAGEIQQRSPDSPVHVAGFRQLE